MDKNKKISKQSVIILWPKGQLISKRLFGVFNSPKKQQKQFNLRYHSGKIKLFHLFFGRIEDTKKTFRN